MTARRALLLLPASLLLGGFFLLPVLGFLAQGVTGPDGFTLRHVGRVLEAPVYLRVLLSSVGIAFWVTLLSVLAAYPVAAFLAGLEAGRRTTWLLLVLLSFWASFLVRTFAWIVILGRNGPVNAGLVALGLSDVPADLLYSRFAVLLGMTNVLIPFAVLTMLGVMEGIPRALTAAAGTLGASPVQAFLTVYLPLSLPGVMAAALLVFITALGFFIAPALLGSARDTMITQLVIQQVLDLQNWPFAAVLCAALLLAALSVFLLFDRAVGLSALAGDTRSAGAGGGRLRRAVLTLAVGLGHLLSRVPVSPGGGGLRALAAAVIAFLLLPLVLIVPVSFSGASFVSWPPTDPTTRWYAEVLASPVWRDAALRSFTVAFLTGALCLLVAVPAAFAFRALGRGASGALFALLVSPLIVPRLVIAVALFWVYARLGLVGTTAGLVLGHAVIALPFVFVSVLSVLKTYDARLDAAAASLGASPLRTARHVTLPLIGTGLVSAFLFAVVISLDELNVALFASGGITSTLPKLMWDEATLRFSPLLAAASTLVLGAMSALVVIAARLRPA